MSASNRQILKNENALEKWNATRHFAPPLNVEQRRAFILLQFALVRLKVFKPRKHRSIRTDARSKRQRVNEESYHRLDRFQSWWPARHRYAENDVLVATVSTQQKCPGCLRQRIQSKAVLPGKVLQSVRSLFR